MADPRLTSHSQTPLRSPGSRLSLSFPFLREGSRVTVRAQSGPVFKGMCKNFSSIEGEYVLVEGDEVTYKVSRVPPKNLKVQAVEVKITHLNPGTKHETWSGQVISS
ncbi:hypothetical protein CRUP_032855 [Coryphaenoides rupestris]|nr:hypothetical protein CRUP_032855 [Coryphaenoides rupestris]